MLAYVTITTQISLFENEYEIIWMDIVIVNAMTSLLFYIKNGIVIKQTIDQVYIPQHVETLIKFGFNYYSDHMSLPMIFLLKKLKISKT